MPQQYESQVRAILQKYRSANKSPDDAKNLAYAIATKNYEKKHGTTPLGNPIPKRGNQ